MIYHKQLRELVIQPALKQVDMYSPSWEEMLIATAAQETLGGYFLKQIEGTAVSIYQYMQIPHDNLIRNYIYNKGELTELGSKFMEACGLSPVVINFRYETGIYNLKYASLIARLYWKDLEFRKGIEPPDPANLTAIWKLYKEYWNTVLGKATISEFFANYNRYLLHNNVV